MFDFLFKKKQIKTQLPDNFDINQIDSQYIQILQEQIKNLTLKEIQSKDFIDFPIINLLSKELIEDIKKFRYDYSNANNPCLDEDRDMFEFHIFLYFKIKSYLVKFIYKKNMTKNIIFNYNIYLSDNYTIMRLKFYGFNYNHLKFFEKLNDQDFILFFNLIKLNRSRDEDTLKFIFHILNERTHLIPDTFSELHNIECSKSKSIKIANLFIEKKLFQYDYFFKDNPYINHTLEEFKIKHMISNF